MSKTECTDTLTTIDFVSIRNPLPSGLRKKLQCLLGLMALGEFRERAGSLADCLDN